MESTAPSRILVFDGDCGFCTKSARWLTRRGDADARAAHTLPLSEEESLHALDAAGWMVDGRIQVWGAAAIAQALRHRGGFSALLGCALTLPLVSSAADVVYGWVARNRHRMPGATDQCRIEPESSVHPRGRHLVATAIAVQVLVPLVALTHPPSRFGFQMFSAVGTIEVIVVDADGNVVDVDSRLLPGPIRADLSYSATLPEFLCAQVPGAARATVADADHRRTVTC